MPTLNKKSPINLSTLFTNLFYMYHRKNYLIKQRNEFFESEMIVKSLKTLFLVIFLNKGGGNNWNKFRNVK
jgi:hypothetical protein